MTPGDSEITVERLQEIIELTLELEPPEELGIAVQELMALMDRQYLKTPFYAKPVAGRQNNPLYESQLPVLIRPQVVRISRG